MSAEARTAAPVMECEHDWNTSYLIPRCNICGFTDDCFRYFNRGIDTGWNAHADHTAAIREKALALVEVLERWPAGPLDDYRNKLTALKAALEGRRRCQT